MCRKVWGFESLRGHHRIPQKSLLREAFFIVAAMRHRCYHFSRRIQRSGAPRATCTTLLVTSCTQRPHDAATRHRPAPHHPDRHQFAFRPGFPAAGAGTLRFPGRSRQPRRRRAGHRSGRQRGTGIAGRDLGRQRWFRAMPAAGQPGRAQAASVPAVGRAQRGRAPARPAGRRQRLPAPAVRGRPGGRANPDRTGRAVGAAGAGGQSAAGGHASQLPHDDGGLARQRAADGARQPAPAGRQPQRAPVVRPDRDRAAAKAAAGAAAGAPARWA